MLGYIKVPESLIRNKNLGDKRVVVFASSLFSVRQSATNSWQSEVALSAGYSLHRRAGGTLAQTSSITAALDGNYLTYNKYSKMVGSPLARYIDRSEHFGVLYYTEYERIMQARIERREQGKKLNQAHLFLLLAYVRLRTDHVDNVPHCSSDLLCRMSEVLGISVRSISSCLKVLEELQILHSEELPRYTDKEGNWHTNVRIFVDMERQGRATYDWRLATTLGIQEITNRRKNRS